MLGLAALLFGAVIGGLLFTALISWALRRFAGAPLRASFFIAWIGACLIAAWGMMGDPFVLETYLISCVGYGIGAWLNYVLAMRQERAKEQAAEFE